MKNRAQKEYKPYVPTKPEKNEDVMTYEKYMKMSNQDKLAAKQKIVLQKKRTEGSKIPTISAVRNKTPGRKIVIRDDHATTPDNPYEKT